MPLVNDLNENLLDLSTLPTREDIHHWRGDTRKIYRRIKDEAGNGLVLESVRCWVKPTSEYEAGDPGTTIHVASVANVNSTVVQNLTGETSPNGYIEVFWSATDTDFPAGDYVWGLEVVFPVDPATSQQDVKTYFAGEWHQYEDVVDSV